MTATTGGAQKRADTIRSYLDALTNEVSAMGDRLARAYELRDWEVLGYASWAEYCEREFGTHMVKLNAGVRKAWQPALKAAGMSTGEIASATGVNRKTIQRDSKPKPLPPAGTNVAPPAFKPAAAEAGTAGQTTTGGETKPAAKDKPEPEPVRFDAEKAPGQVLKAARRLTDEGHAEFTAGLLADRVSAANASEGRISPMSAKTAATAADELCKQRLLNWHGDRGHGGRVEYLLETAQEPAGNEVVPPPADVLTELQAPVQDRPEVPEQLTDEVQTRTEDADLQLAIRLWKALDLGTLPYGTTDAVTDDPSLPTVHIDNMMKLIGRQINDRNDLFKALLAVKKARESPITRQQPRHTTRAKRRGSS